MFDPTLKTFLVVADCHSFTKASQKLYLSPTAIMKQINSFEGSIGLTLFHRSSHGCTLTEPGKVIYDYGRRIVDLSNEAVKKAQKAQGNEKKSFRIATSFLNPAMPFMRIWQHISDQFPSYTIQMQPFDDDHSNVMYEIAQIGHTYDFFMGVCDSKGWFERCNFLPITTMKKMVAVPLNDPLAKKDIITRTDLHGRTLMMVGAGDSLVNDKIRNDLSRNDPEITIQDTPIHYDMNVFNQAITSGNVLLNNECWAHVQPMLKTIPVDWDYTIPYGLIYPKHPQPDIAKLVHVIKNYISHHPEITHTFTF